MTPQHSAATDHTALWASAEVTRLLHGAPENAEIPAYGSSLWQELPPQHPLRYASVLAAAEKWRRDAVEQAQLDHLAAVDPEEWFDEVTSEADAFAARMGRALAEQIGAAERMRRARMRATFHRPRPLTAVPGRPVAIPGQPGWWRHCVDGQQVDLPGRNPVAAVKAA